MVHLSKFIHSNTGKLLMSAILGFGFATLFRKVCVGKNCVIYNAPPLENVKDKTFKYDNKCYKYTHENVKCDTSKKVIEFK